MVEQHVSLFSRGPSNMPSLFSWGHINMPGFFCCWPQHASLLFFGGHSMPHCFFLLATACLTAFFFCPNMGGQFCCFATACPLLIHLGYCQPHFFCCCATAKNVNTCCFAMRPEPLLIVRCAQRNAMCQWRERVRTKRFPDTPMISMYLWLKPSKHDLEALNHMHKCSTISVFRFWKLLAASAHDTMVSGVFCIMYVYAHHYVCTHICTHACTHACMYVQSDIASQKASVRMTL